MLRHSPCDPKTLDSVNFQDWSMEYDFASDEGDREQVEYPEDTLPVTPVNFL